MIISGNFIDVDWIVSFSEMPVKCYHQGRLQVVTEIGAVGVKCLDRESPSQFTLGLSTSKEGHFCGIASSSKK